MKHFSIISMEISNDTNISVTLRDATHACM